MTIGQSSKHVVAGNWYSGGVGYHVSGSRPAVAAPKPSQIPGLGDRGDDASPTDACRPSMRDTDSAYVRLAKQGGQRDLLSMEQETPQDDRASGQRPLPPQQEPSWFYDNSSYRDSTTPPGSRSQLQSDGVAAQYRQSALQ